MILFKKYRIIDNRSMFLKAIAMETRGIWTSIFLMSIST